MPLSKNDDVTCDDNFSEYKYLLKEISREHVQGFGTNIKYNIYDSFGNSSLRFGNYDVRDIEALENKAGRVFSCALVSENSERVEIADAYNALNLLEKIENYVINN